jgi:hypothetical protein
MLQCAVRSAQCNAVVSWWICYSLQGAPAKEQL